MRTFYLRHKKKIIWISIAILAILFVLPLATTRRVDIRGEYTDKEEVALFVMRYRELPGNYITKYGYEYARNHNIDVSDKTIGGDTHVNTGDLSSFGISDSTTLKECDVRGSTYTLTNRGTYRLVYTCNERGVRVFYTDDHYSTFTELKLFDMQLTRNIFWIVFALYSMGFTGFYIVMGKKKKELK